MANQSTISESTLVDGLKAGQKTAFDYLYTHYSAALTGIALRYTGDKELSEEVVHDSFLKIWKGIEKYDPAHGKLFTWMARICRNTALDTKRAKGFKGRKRTESLTNTVITNDKTPTTSLNIETIGIVDLLKDIDDPQADVIRSLYLEGNTQTQASEDLGIPLGTVKTRLRLGMKKIRQNLGLK